MAVIKPYLRAVPPVDVDTSLPPTPSTPMTEEQKGKMVKVGAAVAIGGAVLYLLGKNKPEQKKEGRDLSASLLPTTVHAGEGTVLTITALMAGKSRTVQVKVSTAWGFNAVKDIVSDGKATVQVNVDPRVQPGTHDITVSLLDGQTVVDTIKVGLVVVEKVAGAPGPPPAPAGPVQLPPPTNLTPAFKMSSWSPTLQLRWLVPAGTRWVRVEVIPSGPVNVITPPWPEPVVKSVANSITIAMPQIGVGNYVLLPDQEYIWTVQASGAVDQPSPSDASQWGAAAQSSFRTPKPNSALTVGVVSPQNNRDVDERNPLLRWTDRDPGVFMYEVELSTDKAFKSADAYTGLIHGGQSSPLLSVVPHAGSDGPPIDLLPSTTYYWRVRAATNSRDVSWAGPWSFNEIGVAVAPAPPEAPPTPLAPPSPPTVLPITVGWSANINAEKLSAYISDVTGTDAATVEVHLAGAKDNRVDTSSYRMIGSNGRNPATYQVSGSFFTDAAKGWTQAYVAVVVKDSAGQTRKTGKAGQAGYDTELGKLLDLPQSLIAPSVVSPGAPSTPPASTPISVSWDAYNQSDNLMVDVASVNGTDAVTTEVWVAGSKDGRVDTDSYRVIGTGVGAHSLHLSFFTDAAKGWNEAQVIIRVKGADGSTKVTGEAGQPGYRKDLGKLFSLKLVEPTATGTGSGTGTGTGQIGVRPGHQPGAGGTPTTGTDVYNPWNDVRVTLPTGQTVLLQESQQLASRNSLYRMEENEDSYDELAKQQALFNVSGVDAVWAQFEQQNRGANRSQYLSRWPKPTPFIVPSWVNLDAWRRLFGSYGTPIIAPTASWNAQQSGNAVTVSISSVVGAQVAEVYRALSLQTQSGTQANLETLMMVGRAASSETGKSWNVELPAAGGIYDGVLIALVLKDSNQNVVASGIPGQPGYQGSLSKAFSVAQARRMILGR